MDEREQRRLQREAQRLEAERAANRNDLQPPLQPPQPGVFENQNAGQGERAPLPPPPNVDGMRGFTADQLAAMCKLCIQLQVGTSKLRVSSI